MTRRLTTAQARRDWARALRTASRGTPVIVTSNGQPVAAVIAAVNKLVLVTRNIRDFSGFTGLEIESWFGA